MSNTIRSIEFNGAKTRIIYDSVAQQRGYDEMEEDKYNRFSTRIRHSSFQYAFEAMTPNLLIAYGLELPLDTTEVKFDITFFNKSEWKDNPRFKDLTLTKIIVTGKEAVDGIQLVGTYLSPDGTESPLKSPVIRMTGDNDYNYPLRDIVSSLWETISTCAAEFLKGKTGATPSKQTSIEYPAPQAPEPLQTKARKSASLMGININ